VALRAAGFLLALAVALPALGQERGLELGARYWLSSGDNRFAHNAQAADPTLGNPTSILTYDELDARALELHWRAAFSGSWFFKGHFGTGELRDGAFDDEDYGAGQVKTDDTSSVVRGERFSYLTLDVGKALWASAGGRSRLGVFAGFQQWSEQVDAFGLMVTAGSSPTFPDSLRVISNDVRWRSVRVGVAGTAVVTQRLRVLADLALVPYSEVRNEDSHYLRGDLGPVPNIVTTGWGSGVQLELELRYALTDRLEAGIGVRHWKLSVEDADVSFAGGAALPITEFETKRTGITATVVGRW
jgi:hypothetical protein